MVYENKNKKIYCNFEFRAPYFHLIHRGVRASSSAYKRFYVFNHAHVYWPRPSISSRSDKYWQNGIFLNVQKIFFRALEYELFAYKNVVFSLLVGLGRKCLGCRFWWMYDGGISILLKRYFDPLYDVLFWVVIYIEFFDIFTIQR
jgi:hypothetical protein